MSRGPGKWQRLILDRVSLGRWTYLNDLLPKGYTDSQRKALHRAMIALEDKGHIAVYRYLLGRKRTLIGLAGTYPPAERPSQW